ncbi:hypothetical protein KKA49_04175, partial [Patescibacteria group bacterium]|nr:hypothetical protein [Patescibacteria group bacterium]
MNKVVYKNIKNDLKRLPDDLPKGSWSKQAIRILQERYLDKDDSGKVIETPDEMAWRVAVAV